MIESKINTARVEKEFPKLMVYDGLIVLMKMKTQFHYSGIVLSTREDELDWVVGDYSDSWSPDLFIDFNGSVTIRNKG
jgi:hypothetical protein